MGQPFIRPDQGVFEMSPAEKHPSYRPNPDVIAQRLEQEALLLHLGTDRFYELNRTGTRFWELLAEGHTLEQIRQEMLSKFEVAPEQLAREMNELLSSLVAENLVVAHDAD
jgi:hypothetical protein